MAILFFASLLMLASGKAHGQGTNTTSQQVATAFRNSQVVPDIIHEPPPCLLTASFETANVSLGNYIFATKTITDPIVCYPAEHKHLYTWMLLDIDAPSRASSVLRSYILALYINIPGIHVKKGNTVCPYIPVTPRPGSGLHRYVFLAYKQCQEIIYKNEELVSLSVYRWKFSVKEFIKKYDLLELVAGNYFVSDIPKNFVDFC